MQARHWQLGAATMRALENCEICSSSTLANFTGSNIFRGGPGEKQLPPGAGRDAFAKWIVRIQDDRSLRADGLCESPFLLRNFFARTHELDVCQTNICDDGHIRDCQPCQRCNFTGMIHADLPDSYFVSRGGL